MAVGVPVLRAVRSVLAGTGAITARTGTRIYPEARTQNEALPCIVISMSKEESLAALRPTPLRRAEIEVLVLGATAQDAQEVAEIVRDTMHGYGPETITVGAASINILHGLHSGSLSNYYAPTQGESAGAFAASLMISILYQ